MDDLTVADALAIWLYFRDRRDWNMSQAEKNLEEWALKKIGSHVESIVSRVHVGGGDDGRA